MFTDRGILTRAASAAIVTLALGLTACTYGFAGGTGEPNDPYQLATIDDLLAIGSSSELLSKHYVLINNLDLDPNLPGGRMFDDALIAPDQREDVSAHSGPAFRGVFDGRGHTIRNLSISGKPGHDAGLFGYLSGLVEDLTLEDVRISGSPCGAIAGLNTRGMILRCSVTGQISGSEDVGGMVGTLWDASLMDCRAEVHVMGDEDAGGLVGGGPGGLLIRCSAQVDVQGDTNIGGLTGGNSGACQIIECRASGTVVGVNNVGGLVGNMWGAGMILRCAADCVVVAEQKAGGLVGNGHVAPGTWIMDSHVYGSVAGSLIGGVLGVVAADMRVMHCYAACQMIPVVPEGQTAAAVVGGLFGDTTSYQPPLVISSFWDTDVSGASLSAGEGMQYPGTGLSTELMQQQGTYEQAGWDFASTWAMSEGGYPVLRWEPAADARQQADAGQ